MFVTLRVGRAEFLLPTAPFAPDLVMTYPVDATLDLDFQRSCETVLYLHVEFLEAGISDTPVKGLRFDACLDWDAKQFAIETTSNTDMTQFDEVFKRLLPRP